MTAFIDGNRRFLAMSFKSSLSLSVKRKAVCVFGSILALYTNVLYNVNYGDDVKCEENTDTMDTKVLSGKRRNRHAATARGCFYYV